MVNLFKKKTKKVELKAPVNGVYLPLEEVKDIVFGQKLMGEGVAFKISDGLICAPADGKVILIPHSLHAFGMLLENGAEVLIHIGLDTVALQGEGFTKLVNEGISVKVGTPIIQVDVEKLAEKGIDLTTPMVVTNSKDYEVTVFSQKNVICSESTVVSITRK